MGLSFEYVLMSWTYRQWQAAFKDLGRELTVQLWRDACMEACNSHEFDTMLAFDQVMAAWWTRHVYEPLMSPIVMVPTYRMKATTC